MLADIVDVCVWIRLTHANRLAILIDVLPCTFWHSVCFMHEADMRILLALRSPPVPAKTMAGAISECMQVFDVFPVRNSQARIATRSCHCHGGRFAKICYCFSCKAVSMCCQTPTAPFLPVRLSILPHVLKVFTHDFETRGEDTHGTVQA